MPEKQQIYDSQWVKEQAETEISEEDFVKQLYNLEDN
jgi:hypothetical protein